MQAKLSTPHLLGIRDISNQDIVLILERAGFYWEANRQKNKKHDLLRGRTQINLFFEDSTRTRTSFELAGKRLGADVINISASHSSIKKGESLMDTAMTLDAMHPEYIIIRHPESGAVAQLAKRLNCAVINAGDGCHEHPTQALLDAFAIQRRVGEIKGKTITICGDILHSRVARSNLLLLGRLGAKLRVVGPRTLLPRSTQGLGAEIFTRMEEAIDGADVIMMLRLQRERMQGSFIPSEAEYYHRFGLNHARLRIAKPDVVVMHPGPINRGVEICGTLADDARHSAILEQVEAGVAVRQAILELLARP
jgi:aspartate carbamoyltransferase catalytic subunit